MIVKKNIRDDLVIHIPGAPQSCGGADVLVRLEPVQDPPGRVRIPPDQRTPQAANQTMIKPQRALCKISQNNDSQNNVSRNLLKMH